MFITVKNLVFVLTGGEEDKLVLHSAEVAFSDYRHITLLHHCCGSYYSSTVARESPGLPSFLILDCHGNIKGMIGRMCWVCSQEKHLRCWLEIVGEHATFLLLVGNVIVKFINVL